MLSNHSPPTSPSSPELRFLGMPELRRSRRSQEERASSDEQGAHRKWLCRLAQLRGANAGRRRMRGGGLNSGEAAVVGGDDLFECYPPAENLFAVGNSLVSSVATRHPFKKSVGIYVRPSYLSALM